MKLVRIPEVGVEMLADYDLSGFDSDDGDGSDDGDDGDHREQEDRKPGGGGVVPTPLTPGHNDQREMMRKEGGRTFGSDPHPPRDREGNPQPRGLEAGNRFEVDFGPQGVKSPAVDTRGGGGQTDKRTSRGVQAEGPGGGKPQDLVD
jgi:hypothetical protein